MLFKSVVAGFAIFSMIFGSGNIVFPLILGQQMAGNYFFALCGWLVAAVIIPMGGYYGAMLFDADNKKYLAPIGRHMTSLLMFVIMMLVGPFGVMARIVNVAFGGIHNLAHQIPIWIFSLIFCTIMLLLAYRPGRIVQIIGLIFTPLKFGGIMIIAIIAFCLGGSISESDKLPSVSTFVTGFNMGYQTMDLLAAFVMAGTVYHYVKNAMPENDKGDKKKLIQFTGVACIVSSVVLSVTYIILLLVGAQYSERLSFVAAEEIFGKIAELSMGYSASWFVAIVVAVSCLATGIALCSIFTDYVHKDILKEKSNRNTVLAGVGITAFVMSLLGFQQICSFMGMILEKLYPFLIIFVAIKIVYYHVITKKQK
ncbi:MAG: branched-chain amino acid transport system II carrier protein [Holosporales bacterium]|jgi:LIVCS family branched-chain amino acid:cation transporter|nr:branched-chain amino acid transport system II carrier protein [Holosporales bacterium]